MTEASHLTSTRTAYDTVAVDYEELLRDSLAESPLDRAMLGAFAELVAATGSVRVADVGCGPGRLTGHLRDLGLDVFGVDLSPGMVELARRRHPDLSFEVGSMADLDLPDGDLAGLMAWYSIIHTPPELHPAIFGEFLRVLAPGGQLLLAFQVGDACMRLDRPYGHDVSLDAYRLAPGRIKELLADAGFVLQASMIEERHELTKTPQAYLLARKEDQGRVS